MHLSVGTYPLTDTLAENKLLSLTSKLTKADLVSISETICDLRVLSIHSEP